MAILLVSIYIASRYFLTVDIGLYFSAPAILVSLALYPIGFTARRELEHAKKDAKNQERIKQLATEAERERIARDLHDLAGHSLSSIALKAELAEKFTLNGKMDLAIAEIKQVSELSRDLLSDIRVAITDMNSYSLTKQLSKIESDLTAKGISVSIENKLSGLELDKEKQLTFILTEATTNIIRHSDASEVIIKLTNDNVLVKDNGTVKSAHQRGNGLRGIAERCKKIGGDLLLDSDSGFSICIKFTEKTL
ncbi:sensor histidine kinase [Pseudoalteromonas sp. T1lg65]|uniref:sensor histidine kinase n=1 Tax=Pseudoalteromonas sp. T1lg65 TaxID=2077101 RepID=UPI003F7A856C